MYFIIIHYINFEDFLSVNIMLYKGENKLFCIVILGWNKAQKKLTHRWCTFPRQNWVLKNIRIPLHF